MRYCFLLAILLFSIFTYSQNLRSGGKLKPEQAIMDIRHYTITYDVDPVQQSISGTVEIDLVLSEPSSVLLFDFWKGSLELKKVMVNGKQHQFTHEKDLIRVNARPDESRQNGAVGQAFGRANSTFSGKIKAVFTISGKPAVATRPPWTGGFQWAKDGQGNPWVAITCQGEGAKIYFPCKDHPSDEPNEGADMIITVPKGLVAAGPGLLIKTTTKKDKTTYHWKTNYTISNYCLVFNVGKYKAVSKEYTTVDGNKVPMVFYVLEEHADKAPHHLDVLERTTKVLEKYFGEYPFAKEKIGICETPHLGMEHQTLNGYGNKFQYTKVGGEDFDWLLTHEFGHEWWANKVTNIDWAHMWIQEGICSYGDALYTRELAGEEAYLKRMAQTARGINHSIPVVRGEDAVDTDSAYAAPIYGKGAFFMHTLRYILGDDVFFPTLKKLATDQKYTYDHFVNTRDVQKLFSEASGKDLKPLFDFYLYNTQKLEIRVRQSAEEKYTVQLLNFDGPLPIDIQTDSGIQRTIVDKKGVQVSSKSMVLVDPKVYYMKKVIYE